jgi:carbon monoxide dehydrogenase subunit G
MRHQTEIEVEASADRAWAVLADLASVQRWIPGIASVEVDGFQRVCIFQGGAVQHEEISDLSPESMSYRYTIEGGPLPVTRNLGAFRVEAIGGGRSRILWDAELDFAPGAPSELETMVEGAYSEVAANLKRVIEEGT